MKSLAISAFLITASAGVVVLGTVGFRVAGAAGAPSFSTSSNVSVIPQSSAVTLDPAQASDITVSAETAVQSATAQWNLAPGQIDPSIGAVQADATINGDPLHQHQEVWMLVADYPTASPANGIEYQKLVIVIDGKTGKYIYAYPVDPNLTQYNKVFGSAVSTKDVARYTKPARRTANEQIRDW